MKSKCFLTGYGECSAKISREHYISKTVLNAMSDGERGVKVGGLPWQPPMRFETFGINSLQVKSLCTSHNNRLAYLDSAGGKLFRTLNDVDKNPKNVPALTQVNGHLTERWFLKILSGLAVAAGFGNGSVPERWKNLLTGGEWTDGWGIYILPPVNPEDVFVFANEFYIETHINPDNKAILAATFRVAGVPFLLVLGRPDNPALFGVHRPRGLIFRLPDGERRLEFLWESPTNRAIIYTKIPGNYERPPQWERWND